MPLDYARKMLGVEKLPQDLMDRIHLVQSHYAKVGGSPLRLSRQIVALVVAQYQIDKQHSVRWRNNELH